MPKPQVPAARVLTWLRDNLGAHSLGALTGADTRSLQAAVQILEAYAYDRNLSLLLAFSLIVNRMQPKCWEFAYHAIAMVLDWSDRPQIWTAAGLPQIEPHLVCAWSPEARKAVA